MGTNVYLSYRRSTDGAIANRLAERLQTVFGIRNVFYDASSLNAGEQWLDWTKSIIRRSDVVLVVIGSDWLTAADSSGTPRLHSPSDFIRFEVTEALFLDKLVIPVLVEGADMPRRTDLPDELAPLAGRQSMRIRHSTFDRDVTALLLAIKSGRPQPPSAFARRVRWFALAYGVAVGSIVGMALLYSARGLIRESIGAPIQWLIEAVRSTSAAVSAILSRIDWRDAILVLNTGLLAYVTWRSSTTPGTAAPVRAAQKQNSQSHRVFICYRREDSSYATSYIYDKLEDMLGAGVIFKDVDSIPYGTDFRTHVQEKLTNCQVCLIVIGKSWLSIVDKNGNQRLFQDKDPVRTEVETVLGRNMLVIPILIDNAPMPDQSELPAPLEKLSSLNGIQVRPHPDFQADVQRLASAIA